MPIPTTIPINREAMVKEFFVETIHTLQEFMLHTKNIIYVLMVAALLAFPAFWRFLTGRDDVEDDSGKMKDEH